MSFKYFFGNIGIGVFVDLDGLINVVVGIPGGTSFGNIGIGAFVDLPVDIFVDVFADMFLSELVDVF